MPAGDITSPDDPLAWHPFPPHPEIGMRRHRRIDLWREGDQLVVDAFFRDICWERDGRQLALYEYTVVARIDAEPAAAYGRSRLNSPGSCGFGCSRASIVRFFVLADDALLFSACFPVSWIWSDENSEGRNPTELAADWCVADAPTMCTSM